MPSKNPQPHPPPPARWWASTTTTLSTTTVTFSAEFPTNWKGAVAWLGEGASFAFASEGDVQDCSSGPEGSAWYYGTGGSTLPSASTPVIFRVIFAAGSSPVLGLGHGSG